MTENLTQIAPIDKQGRDDRLARQIIAKMEAIRLRSDNSYDDLVNLITTSRYPVAAAKIRKLAYPQMVALGVLIDGYETRINADQSPIINAMVRPATTLTVGAAQLPQVLTLQNPQTLLPQDVLLTLIAANYSAHTFYTSNPGAVADDSIAILTFANQPTLRPALAKVHDQLVTLRNPNLQVATGDPLVRTLSLDVDGNLVEGSVTTALTPGAATFVDRALIEDFCDGRYLWAMEYDDTNNVLRIHKKLLASPFTETIQVVNNFEGTAEAALFAVGDNAVLIGVESSGATSVAMFFTVTDGVAPGALDFAGATTAKGIRQAVETAVPTQLRGANIGGPVRVGSAKMYRAFMTPNVGGANAEAVRAMLFDPTPHVRNGVTEYDIVQTPIYGYSEGWPIGAAAALGNMALSADHSRVMIATEGAVPLDVLLFSLTSARQLTALVPVASRVLTILELSRINATGSHALGIVTTAHGTHMVRLAL